MVPPFQLLGPSKNPYPGTFCLPQVPLPVNATVKAGDNATIQLVELAVHGAALYSVGFLRVAFVANADRWLTMILQQCVDITFVEPGDERLAEVNETNCFNSSDLGIADIYTLTVRASGATNATSDAEHRFYFFRRGAARSIFATLLGWAPVVLGGMWILL